MTLMSMGSAKRVKKKRGNLFSVCSLINFTLPKIQLIRFVAVVLLEIVGFFLYRLMWDTLVADVLCTNYPHLLRGVAGWKGC